MRKLRKVILSTVILGLVAGSFTGCIEKTVAAKRAEVVAKGKDIKVTMGELTDKMKSNQEQIKQQYGANYGTDPDAMEQLKKAYTDMLTQLVEEKILDKKAAEMKVIPDPNKVDEEVQKQIDLIKKTYYNNNDQNFNNSLTSNGYTLDALKNEIKEQLKTDKNELGRERVMYSIVAKLTVTDAEIKTYYDQNTTQYTQNPGANIAHILVATEQDAKSLKDRLSKGEKFEDLAKSLSKDANTKDNGGSYGFLEYTSTTVSTEVMDAAKKLTEGQVSNPIKTKDGYEIIKVTGIVKDKKVTSLDEVKESIKSTLLQNKQQTEYNKDLEQWKKDFDIKTYEDVVNKNIIV